MHDFRERNEMRCLFYFIFFYSVSQLTIYIQATRCANLNILSLSDKLRLMQTTKIWSL